MEEVDLIILGPGGIKGYLEMGALYYLERCGTLNSVKTYVGVSIGAIISLLLVAGYHVDEIIEYSLSFSLFQDFLSIDINEVGNNAGLISNQHIKLKLEECLIAKFGLVPTLKQLYDFSGIKLVTVTLNITKTETEYISYENEPELSCVDAVLLSINIPLIFHQLKYKGCYYIDGALGNPYPIDKFDDGKTNILGIYIDHKPNCEGGNHFISYLYYILHSMTNSLKNLSTRNCSPRCKHLILYTDLIDTIGLNITDKEKSEMVREGYKMAQDFMSKLEQS